MGAIEPWHLILLLAVVLLVVGPGKLPQVGKGAGEAIREFRKATIDLQSASRDAPPSTGGQTIAKRSDPTVATAPSQPTTPGLSSGETDHHAASPLTGLGDRAAKESEPASVLRS